MAINLNDNIKINAGKPSESKYLNTSGAPYTGTSQVTSQVAIGERHVGLTVNINNVEYWFATGVTNGDLIEKTPSVAAGGGITGATNGLTKVGANVTLGGTLTGDTSVLGSNSGLVFDETGFVLGAGAVFIGGGDIVNFINPRTYVAANGSNNAGIYYGTSNKNNYFEVDSTGIDIYASSGTSSLKLEFDAVNNFARFTDGRVTKTGIQYGADYSANFTPRSLVDKGYVTGLTTTSGIQTANNGLTKSGTNVRLGGTLTGDTLIGGDAGSYDLTLGGIGTELNNFSSTGSGIGTIDYPTLNLNGDSANKQIILDNTGINLISTTIVSVDSTNFDIDDQDLTFTLGNSVTIDAGGAGTMSLNSNNLITAPDEFSVTSTNTITMLSDGDTTLYAGAANLRLSGASVIVGSQSGTFEGAIYAADYSGNYTNRSLVDKGYVDSVSAATNTTASNGLTKTGNDIALGGTLTSSTIIDGDATYDFTVNNSPNISLAATDLSLTATNDATVEGSNSTILQSNSNDITIGSTGINITLDGTNKLTYNADYSANYNDRSLVDKGYVDTIAVGLDPKEAAKVATVTAMTGTYISSGGTNNSGSFTGALTIIDGIQLSIGDRVLVKDQVDKTENGLYYLITTGGTYYRTTDQDGTPTAEVSTGNYVFITTGNTNAASGWVVIGSGDTLTLNVDDIEWVQFSASISAYLGGNGIDITGANISVDLAANSGLDFNSGQLRVNPTIGGNGLTLTSGVLDVDLDPTGGLEFNAGQIKAAVGNGLTLYASGNSIHLGGSLTEAVTTINGGGNSLTFQNTLFSVDGTQLTMDSTIQTNVQSTARVFAGLTSNGGSLDFTTGGTIFLDNSNVVSDRNGIQYGADYSANFTPRSLVDKGYVTGLTTTSGIQTANNGLTKSGTNVRLGGSLTGNTTIDGTGNLTVDLSSNSISLIAGGTITIDSGTWAGNTDMIGPVTFNEAASYAADYSANFTPRSLVDKGYVTGYTSTAFSAGSGLTLTSGVFDVDLDPAGGLEFNAGQIKAAVGNGLTLYASGNSIHLGGSLTEAATTISGGGNSLSFQNTLFSVDGTQLTMNSTVQTNIQSTARVFAGLTSNGGSLDFTTGGTIFQDISTNVSDRNGIEYAADYSANYTNRSLVDKGYVTGLTSNVNKVKINVINTSTTLTNNQHVLLVNTSGATTLTLPASPVDGQVYHIKDKDGNALTNMITVNGNGKTIDGASTATINTDFGSLHIVYSSVEDAWFGLAFIN